MQTSLRQGSDNSLVTEKLANPALLLSPYLCSDLKEFIDEQDLLFALVNGLGSPLNIIFPDLLEANVNAFQTVFDAFNLTGKIYFAHKTNRADSIVKKLALEDVCIDVASCGELKHALGGGFAADRIEATGPKKAEFILLALAHNIVINVDSIEELNSTISLKQAYGHIAKTPILLRISQYSNNATAIKIKPSRFGISLNETEMAFDILSKNTGSIELKGFSFHLDTVSIGEKTLAIDCCLDLLARAYAHGLQPDVLNIGGGFKLNYLTLQLEWDNYITALKESVLGMRSSITWQGNSFGLRTNNKTLQGGFNSYNYYDPLAGAKFLQELLCQTLPNHGDMQIAQFLKMNGISLWIEPGRSLLDQVGITVGRVVSIRTSSQGDLLVCLDMKRQDLCFLDQEFFVDPVIAYQNREHNKQEKRVTVYFAGNLCLESDLIYRHQTFLSKIPKAGDLVVFPNTAAYFMDFSACEAIMQPIANKVAIYKKENKFTWACDDQYQPLAPFILEENHDS